MGFFDWYVSCIKDHYVDFEGRARRTEYWMYQLVNVLVVIVVGLIARMLHLEVLSSLYSLAVLLPTLAVTPRRLHDTDRSAWWILIGLVPVIGWIWLIVLMVLEGNQGSNQYGADPKQAA